MRLLRASSQFKMGLVKKSVIGDKLRKKDGKAAGSVALRPLKPGNRNWERKDLSLNLETTDDGI
jgi:hypothetical protein